MGQPEEAGIPPGEEDQFSFDEDPAMGFTLHVGARDVNSGQYGYPADDEAETDGFLSHPVRQQHLPAGPIRFAQTKHVRKNSLQ